MGSVDGAGFECVRCGSAHRMFRHGGCPCAGIEVPGDVDDAGRHRVGYESVATGSGDLLHFRTMPPRNRRREGSTLDKVPARPLRIGIGWVMSLEGRAGIRVNAEGRFSCTNFTAFGIPQQIPLLLDRLLEKPILLLQLFNQSILG